MVSRNNPRVKDEKCIVGTMGRIGKLRKSWKDEKVLFVSFGEYLCRVGG